MFVGWRVTPWPKEVGCYIVRRSVFLSVSVTPFLCSYVHGDQPPVVASYLMFILASFLFFIWKIVQ